MAKIPMARLEIIALITDGKSVIERLQRRGVVNLIQRDTEELPPGLETVSTGRSVAIFEQNKHTVTQALSILDEYAPVKSSMLAAFQPRSELTTAEFGEQADRVEDAVRQAYEIGQLAAGIADKRGAIKTRQQAIASLEYWRPLEMSMRFSGTPSTAAFIGTLNGEWSRESLLGFLEQEADEQTPMLADVQVVYASKERSGVFVLAHAGSAEACEQALREKGFAAPSVVSKEPPAAAIKQYEADIDSWRREIEEKAEAIRAKADWRPSLKFTVDYLEMRQDKYKALEDLLISDKTMIMEGYIPKKDAAALQKEMEAKYPFIYVGLSEPDPEDEDVPVAFKNAMPAYALEDVTMDYSMPGRGDIDPNPIMAIFYYLFFGLMFSEGGYGLIMVIATAVILLKFRPEGNMKRNMQKFFLCGVSTVFWGAIFGSWFGDAVTSIHELFVGKDNGVEIPALTEFFYINGTQIDLNKPMTLLIFSLILGFIHVMVGMGIKFYMLCRSGHVLDALLDVGMWWVVFAGLVVAILSMVITTTAPLMTTGLLIAAGGGVGLVLTQGRGSKSIPGKIMGGVASLYDVTGYFSDILSYCRLMALALVTGQIAIVFNMLGTMVSGVPVLGYVFYLLIFVFGHAINFGINVLGAYVHGNRLQYVEFFSKFYEGGGKPFVPFKVNTKFYKFKEDN